ncbi:serine/threonine-protein kinase [Parvularcula sp. LCG005]|uniref:serine/threonine-protein kinase n=1 Tax=Parvularcula sp. LCG005 TaxID=3078805 RepID=UPI002943242A|nr:serine/threonine-protein kinase [Parvularcula sp. LCG005]WOI54421.1 serine/threonine-protein kinase [Parvularcula sp. LCG005]
MTSSNDLEKRALTLFEEALDQPSDHRRAWIIKQAGDDTALLNRALAFHDLDTEDAVSIHTGGAIAHLEDDAATPERIGQYRIVRLIGRGGMGAVYLGERDAGDFDHEVAIKLVSGIKRSPKLSERLRAERQTLAQLLHPYIARLYDGGELDDGTPYFVMEYVPGTSLGEYLSQHRVSRDDGITLFLNVCSAVQYAHQKLIVHRDLSPSNILLSDDGDPKLIDFGISHTFGDDTDTDHSGRLTMTRGYAAPERISGHAATTLGDIYSLGLILKDILRSAQPGADEDLTAIVAKASNEDPERRYTSVGALMTDLERYRTGHTVNARNGGGGYAMAKFIGRRRLSVAAGTVGLVMVLGALTAVSVLYTQAEEARRESDRRFEDVRSLANTLMFDIYDAVEDVSGAFKARELILETVSDYLHQVEGMKSPSRDLQLEMADGFYRLADVQGDFTGASLGQIEASKENRATSRRLYEALIEQYPNYAKGQNAYADFLHDAANQEVFRERNTDRAAKTIAMAEAASDRALALEPDNADFFRTRLAVMKIKSDVLQYSGQHDAAEALTKEQLEITRQWLETHDDDRVVYSLTGMYRDLGTNLFDQGQYDEARIAFERALEASDRFLANQPDNRNGRHGRMIIHWQLALLNKELEQYDEARVQIGKGLDIVKASLAVDPDNRNGRRELAILSETAAELDAEAGNREAALSAANDAYLYFKSAHDAAPDERGAIMDFAYVNSFMGSVHRRLKMTDESCHYYQQVETIMAGLAAEGPLMAEDDTFRAQNAEDLANCRAENL